GRGRPAATLRLPKRPGRCGIVGTETSATGARQSGRKFEESAMDHGSKTPLLDRVKTPRDLRALPEKDLRQLVDELRQETIDAVSVTGGHLGAGLGVVELTVALHR